MQKTETRKAGNHHKEPKTVQGLLLSALDMEDEITRGALLTHAGAITNDRVKALVEGN